MAIQGLRNLEVFQGPFEPLHACAHLFVAVPEVVAGPLLRALDPFE